MDKTFFNYGEALSPATFTICGIELKSFSLGHWMILDRLGSPFLSTNPNCNVPIEDGTGDLFILLLICAQTYEDNERMLADEKIFNATLKKFEKHIRKFIKKDKRWNIFKEVRWVKDYLAYFIKMPNFTDRSNPSTPSGIDWKQNLFTIMRNEYHYEKSEILNMPVRRLFYEWCSFAEKNGAIQVSNIYEMEALKNIGVKV